jgi:hypothetical protein
LSRIDHGQFLSAAGEGKQGLVVLQREYSGRGLGLTAAVIAGIYVNRGGAKDHRALPTMGSGDDG